MSSSRDDQFIERYLECQSGLDRLIATLVPNRADAEELFQEASLTAWKIRDRFDPLREMSPWLCGTARNLVATWTAHWSDDSGRRWRGQLVEIRNPAEPLRNNHWDRATSWGRAVYR